MAFQLPSSSDSWILLPSKSEFFPLQLDMAFGVFLRQEEGRMLAGLWIPERRQPWISR